MPGTRGKANSRQVGGDHYRSQAIQPWDFITANGLGFLEGCVIKRLVRSKGDRVEDLEKAKHELEKLIEIEKEKQA